MNGQGSQRAGEEAPALDTREHGVAELERRLRGAEVQIRALALHLSDHDSRIAELQGGFGASAPSLERNEKSLQELKAELPAHQRRPVEVEPARRPALSDPQKRSAAIEQTHRIERERLNRALQRTQLEVASARSRELIAARDCATAQRAYDEVVSSPSWKATRPLRVAAQALSPKLRRPLHYAATVAYWLVTPLSMPQRLRDYLTKRQAERRFAAEYDLVATSSFFDAKWYVAHYPDVGALGHDPLAHYLTHGAAESRDPGPAFDTSAYVEANPDVATSGVNPLVHYISHGFLETRPLAPEQTSRRR